MEIRPLKNRIIGKLKGESKKSGSIILIQKQSGVRQLLEVQYIGPDCKEVNIGDICVLPDVWSGAVLEIYDDESDITESLFVISEDAILATIREV
jgi:co-chaperonin GroES (HSP10)